jgi:hypothetical protein
VVDRPIFANLVALILSATLGWPCSLYPSSATGIRTTSSPSLNPIAAPKGVMRTSELKKSSQRHARVILDTLEDDPSIVGIEPEDWVEICTCMAPEYGALPAHGAFAALTQPIAIRVTAPADVAPLTNRLCRFQC